METETDKSEVQVEAPVVEPKVEAPKEPASEPVVEPKAPDSQAAPKWAMDTITKLRARVRQAEQARATGAPAPVNPQTGQQFTPEQILAMQGHIQAEAQKLAVDTDFTNRCNAARSEGEAKYGDFATKVQQIAAFVNADPETTKSYNQFLHIALETGEAAKLVHMMGSDLNLAARILAMSPAKMALEVAKMTLDKGAPEPSKAPKPIKPVGSAAPITGISADDPQRSSELSTAAWMKARQAQAKERGIR